MSSDTDLYLLPAIQDAAAAKEVIAPLLRTMGVSRIEEATVYSSGEWEHDAGEQSARYRDLSVDAFRDLCNHHAGEYVMAHVDSPFLAVAQNIVTRHPDAAMEGDRTTVCCTSDRTRFPTGSSSRQSGAGQLPSHCMAIASR